MNLDNNSLKRLLQLDDESFKRIIKQISAAAGANAAKTETLLSNVEGIKSSLAKMTPQEAEKIINAAGKEKSEEIFRILKGGR